LTQKERKFYLPLIFLCQATAFFKLGDFLVHITVTHLTADPFKRGRLFVLRHCFFSLLHCSLMRIVFLCVFVRRFSRFSVRISWFMLRNQFTICAFSVSFVPRYRCSLVNFAHDLIPDRLSMCAYLGSLPLILTAASENQDPYPCSQIIPNVNYPFWKKDLLNKEILKQGKPLE
jgi:hypothetical protein